MIPSLQVFRGIAAIMVIFFHLRLVMGKYFESALYTEMWVFGRYGVQFFFVLSGFIIYHAHHRDLGDRSKIPVYLYKRFSRIYPAYWVVTLLLLPFWIGVAEFGQPHHKEFSSLVYSLLLFPQSHEPHLGVGWTLVHEILFYVMFVALLVSRKFLAGALVWALVIIGYSLSGLKTHYLVDFFLSPNNLLFLFGVAVCIVHHKFPKNERWAGPAMIAGILMFIAGGVHVFNHRPDEHSFPVILFFGIASVLLVLGSNAPAIEKKYFSSRLLMYFGNASYSIYLVHYPFLSFSSKALHLMGAKAVLPNAVIWLILATAALVAGCIFHEIVEKPLVNLGRRYLKKIKQRREEGGSSAD